MTSQCLHYDCGFRNNAGYCKISACVNPKYNNQLINTNVSKKPQTNADRIRAMSDEELAELLYNGCTGHKCTNYYPEENLEEQCKRCWLDWLKQEVADDGT